MEYKGWFKLGQRKMGLLMSPAMDDDPGNIFEDAGENGIQLKGFG